MELAADYEMSLELFDVCERVASLYQGIKVGHVHATFIWEWEWDSNLELCFAISSLILDSRKLLFYISVSLIVFLFIVVGRDNLLLRFE